MADFDRITDENGVTKYVKDSNARNNISLFQYQITCVLTPVHINSGSAYTCLDLDTGHILGSFSSSVNGSCIRVYFPLDSQYIDWTLPVQFRSYDNDLHQNVYYDVWKDASQTTGIQGLYHSQTILDFVFDKTNHCFYLVNPQSAAGTANTVSYDNTVSGLAATDVQAAIDELADEKVDKVSGKGLSEEDFTTTYKTKLDSINAGAEVNVQSNWTEADTTSDAYIRNKPSLATVATSGDYGDLINKPTIPAAQVNSDWDAASGVAQILNKPSLATVATSGDYGDLINTPDLSDLPYIETVTHADDFDSQIGYTHNNIVKYNDKMYRCTLPSGTYQGGPFDPAIWEEVTVGGLAVDIEQVSDDVNNLAAVARTGDYNDISNTPTIPGLTSELVNDSGFLTSSDVASVAMSGNYSDLNGTPTIPAAQVNSDWNANSGVAEILNKPSLATVATSGLYSDLSGTPTIPSGVDTFVDASLPSTTGTDFSGYSSGRVVCPANVAKSIGTVEIAAGYWLLEISAMWYSNGTGYRMLGLSTTKNTFSSNKNYTISQNAVNGVETYQRIAIVVHPTTATRYHIIVKQNVGDIYVSPEYKAIRLEH